MIASLLADLPLWADGSGLFDGELTARGGLNRFAALLLGLVAVAAVCALYAFESARLGVARRVVLAAVRMAIVAVVAFLLVRPVWIADQSAQRPRPVAVLLDASQSMDQKDPRP
ncbi:MAG: hypothetical protein K2V38_20725, partial [Gemmataceae bacterium]|nr:hypothetical protein [Gemmataceae bacterium]